MDITRKEIKQSVRDIAHLIRAHDPYWFNKIDLTQLDVADIHNCILTQIFGTFINGIETLSIGHLFNGSGPVALSPSYDETEIVREEWLKFVNYLKQHGN